MSPDWPWLVVLALVVPPALGHLYHFVLSINVGSGLGFREPVMDRVRDSALRGLLDLLGALALDAPARRRGGPGRGRSGATPSCAWSRAR